jgi:predicted component of type VI protein secretion system
LPCCAGSANRELFEEQAKLVTAQDRGDPLARHSLSPRELKELLVAEAAAAASLAYRDGDGSLRLLALEPAAAPITVGRRGEAGLALPWDREVSGVHAELLHLGGEWTVQDDGLSMNGTFVNGERVRSRQRLRDGDRVRVGKTVLACVFPQSGSSAQTQAASQIRAVPRISDAQRKVLVALCRPYRDGASFTSTASNRQIADELFLSVDAVKMHLRALFAKFDLAELPQNRKRTRLAECALEGGVVSPADLA